METRASHIAVGIFVLLLSIGAAVFGTWLAKRDVDRTFTLYEIVFPGSVFGLQQGSSVVFSGVPVGRVVDIGIDPENTAQVLVTAEIEQSTPVTTETTAALVSQGVTGLLVIELRGGGIGAPRLVATHGEHPRIAGQLSALEQVFTSTPELLARGVAVMERVASLLSDENLERLSASIGHVEQLTGTLAAHDGDLGRLLAASGDIGEEARAALAGLNDTLAAVGRLTASMEEEVGGLGGKGEAALGEIEAASRAARNLAWRADRILGASEQPLQDFSDGGLYEFGEMVREIRILVAAMSRIATDFERDPAGFLIGGSRRGFTPQ